MQNCVPFGKRIFTWTVRQHFQSQPMKSTIIAIITSALALSCSVNKGEYKEFRKEEINNLYFEYYLSDQKFTDTLKVYSLDKDLIQFTVWENGSIISRSTVDDSGRIRELKLYERIDTTSEGISIIILILMNLHTVSSVYQKTFAPFLLIMYFLLENLSTKTPVLLLSSIIFKRNYSFFHVQMVNFSQ